MDALAARRRRLGGLELKSGAALKPADALTLIL
jgi:hypothetical protein